MARGSKYVLGSDFQPKYEFILYLLSRQPFLLPLVPLPVAAPVMMRPGPDAFLRDVHEDAAVSPAPGVLAVGRLVGVVGQIQVSELVDLTILHAPEPREVGLSQVVRGAVVGAILQAVIHAPGVELGVQRIIGIGFVGADRRAGQDVDPGQLAHVLLILGLQHEGQGLVRAQALTGQFLALLAHDEDAPLVRLLMLGQAAVDPLGFLVLRPNMAVHVGTIHVDLTGQWLGIPVFHQRFSDLVRQHEGGLVLDAQITTQLQGRHALHSIGEQGDGGEIHLQRQLVEGEDRAGRDREGVIAGFAAPLLPATDEVVAVNRATDRAGHFLTLAPADRLEGGECFRLCHFHDLPDRQRAGGGGEQEVLFVSHVHH